MFSILLLIPTVSFFVLGTYVGHVFKYVSADILNLILRKRTQVPQIIDVELFFSTHREKLTNFTNILYAQAIKTSPKKSQYLLPLQRKAQLTSIEYRIGSRVYKYFYSKNNDIVFPPTKLLDQLNPARVKCVLVLSQKCISISKSICLDVSDLILPLLGPQLDWFEGTQRSPLIVYTQLEDKIQDLISGECWDPCVKIKAVLNIYDQGDKEVINLSRLLIENDAD